jgi:hypothetical protein
MIISTDLDSNENLLRYSVTYDFEAFNHLTLDKSRFINEIIVGAMGVTRGFMPASRSSRLGLA